MELDFERCYRAVDSRDLRFDGRFYTGVTSTGIYCRPSCPAMTPKRRNVRFLPSAAAAQGAGLRACRRCRPDAAPGSPEWDVRADLVGRAMRLIADGVVDREGVTGLARRLGYTERHLNRMLTAEMGAGPLALARAQRAQTARILIETTGLGLAEIAFAAGLRQPAAVQRHHPGRLRRRRPPSCGPPPAPPRRPPAAGTLALRLAYRPPLHAGALLDFLGRRAMPGVEEVAGTYRRGLWLPHGDAEVALTPGPEHVAATLHLTDLRDLAPAVARCRRLLDLDADPEAVDTTLAADPALAAAVAAEPGVRVPGTADGFELAVRAVVGQQISVAGAQRVLARLLAAARGPHEQPHAQHEPEPHAGPHEPQPHGSGERPDAPHRLRPFLRPRSCWRCRTTRTGCRRRGGRRCAGWPRWSPKASWTWRRGPTGRQARRGCSRCPGSAPGPPATSRNGRSATRTSSSPPTWPCGVPPDDSASPPTPGRWPPTPPPGAPGVPTP